MIDEFILTNTDFIEHTRQLQRFPRSYEGPAKDGLHARRLEQFRMGRCPSHVYIMVGVTPARLIEVPLLIRYAGKICCLPQ